MNCWVGISIDSLTAACKGSVLLRNQALFMCPTRPFDSQQMRCPEIQKQCVRAMPLPSCRFECKARLLAVGTDCTRHSPPASINVLTLLALPQTREAIKNFACMLSRNLAPIETMRVEVGSEANRGSQKWQAVCSHQTSQDKIICG